MTNSFSSRSLQKELKHITKNHLQNVHHSPFWYWWSWRPQLAGPCCWRAPPWSTLSSGGAEPPRWRRSWSSASFSGRRRERTAPAACWTRVAGRDPKRCRGGRVVSHRRVSKVAGEGVQEIFYTKRPELNDHNLNVSDFAKNLLKSPAIFIPHWIEEPP